MNMTPEQFLETYGGDPQTFEEVMNAYQDYIQEVVTKLLESGEEFDRDLLSGELSYDKFITAYKNKLDSK